MKKGILGIGALGIMFIGGAAVDVYGADLLKSRVAQKTAHNAQCIYALGRNYASARRILDTETECRHSTFASFSAD